MFVGGSASTENKEHEVFTKAIACSGTQRIKKNNNNSRRFSDEQIKSLESMFKTENKLEPRKKLEMARELGLHPRQVAIWFQNRRARWKSKQMEQDYTTLRADYDTLSHRFQSLKKEKHALLKQLRNLCSQLKQPHEAGRKFDLDSGSEENDGELNGNSSGFSGPLEQQDMQQEAVYYSDEDDLIKYNDDEKEEIDENVKMQGGDCKVSKEEEITHEKVSNFDLGSLFDQSCAGTYCSNWWDVWSTN